MRFLKQRARCINKSQGHGQFIMNTLNLFTISEIKISYFPKFKASERPLISNSQSCFEIFRNNWDNGDLQYRESFAILLLSRSNKVIGINWISQGGLAGTVADPKMIFQAALKANAASIILAHNHPSGNINPSQNDIDLTKKLVNAGQFLDLPVLDHLIITDSAYFSHADEGLI